MANSAELIRTLSKVTGIPLPTVVDIDRKLVKAGLRNKGGRGLHAARMTALDAAHLLTAILACPQANQSASAVERYRLTKVDPERSNEGYYGATGIDDLAALSNEHGFVDALAALIKSAATGSLSKLMADHGDDWTPHIEVFAFTGVTYARVRMSGLPNRMTANVEYRPAKNGPKAKTGTAARRDDDFAGDVEQSRRLSERTILSVATLLAEES